MVLGCSLARKLVIFGKPPARRSTKRIAVCLPNIGGGGAERVGLEIIDDLLTQGHQVDLVLVQAIGELMPLVPAGVRIIDLKAKRMRNALIPLIRYLRRERPDAMQVSMWPLTVLAILARMVSRSPTVLVISDHVSFASASAGLRFAVGLSAGLFYRFADHRVAVSQGTLSELAKLTELDHRQFELIYNPIAVPDEIRSSKQAESAWGGSDCRILTVGSLKPAKNHALLLEAFARLDRPNARLMILGDGPLREELGKLAEEMGIADQLVMPGFAIDPWPYYASADLFVLSSNREGLPLVLLEALAAGVPVVSTDCPSGPAEILGNGQFGTLVPTRDADALAEAMRRRLQETNDPAPGKVRAATFAGDPKARYRELLLGA